MAVRRAAANEAFYASQMMFVMRLVFREVKDLVARPFRYCSRKGLY